MINWHHAFVQYAEYNPLLLMHNVVNDMAWTGKTRYVRSNIWPWLTERRYIRKQSNRLLKFW